MLQQASNFQEAHDDNLGSAAIADGLWVMYDYNRGYAPDIESSGCMDIFRLPKYSYHFFRSQRSPDEQVAGARAGAVVFIASEWTPVSSANVRIFSNCDEVELRLNGSSVGRRRPERGPTSAHLAHPPFVFPLGRFSPGTLEAVGYLDGRAAGRHEVRSPGAVDRLRLQIDGSGRAPGQHGKDAVFCRASLHDASDTVVASAWENVAFGTTGSASLIGANPFSSDAGIASILAVLEPRTGPSAVYTLSIVRDGGVVRLLGASARLSGGTLPFEIRWTADGRAPGAGSPRYEGPLSVTGPVRAALVVEGRVVATADERTPKFRIRGSAAPASREPFKHG
jgi:beta-galactosidase